MSDIHVESITPTENAPSSTSILNPNSNIFISRFSSHVLNPFAECFDPVLSPLADSFSPHTNFSNPSVKIFEPENLNISEESSLMKLGSVSGGLDSKSILKLDSNTPVFDTTPQIFEYNTPNTSFNDSFCCQNEVDLIKFSPVRVIISGARNAGAYVISSRSDLHSFTGFSYFIYNLSLIIILAIVIGPENERGYPDHSFSSEDPSNLSDVTNTSSDTTPEHDRLNEENAHEILLNLRKKKC